MSNDDRLRKLLVSQTLNVFPPEIRDHLFSDQAFFARWGIETTKLTTLGRDGPAFNRHALHQAILEAQQAAGDGTELVDSDGNSWALRTFIAEESMHCTLSRKGREIEVKDLSPLSADGTVRASWIKKYSDELDLDRTLVLKWDDRLRNSFLTEDQYDELLADIEATPAFFVERFQRKLLQQEFSFLDMVPSEKRYYERLSGETAPSSSFFEFLDTSISQRLREAVQRRSKKSLRYALFLCTFSGASRRFDVSDLEEAMVVDLLTEVARDGDPMSCVAAVEVALGELDRFPVIEPLIERLIRRLIDDRKSGSGSSLALFCSVAKAIASQIWRNKALDGFPPYVHRHCALSHASIVTWAILKNKSVDGASISAWIEGSGLVVDFYIKGMVDLRQEPRWLPDFMEVDQFFADCSGRIANAANSVATRVGSKSLQDLIVGYSSEILGMSKSFHPFLPGPLDGSSAVAQSLPEDMQESIRSSLQQGIRSTESFSLLINTSLYFNIPTELADLASSSLQRVNYSLKLSDSATSYSALIRGLAIVAATARSKVLCETLRIFVRVLRRKGRLDLPVLEEVRLCLIAAASHEERDAWARVVGDWITEIAFEMDDRASAPLFLLQLQRLQEIEPQLQLYVSRASAAVECLQLS